MGNGLILKFKGNKSFVAFSNLGDTEALAKTWKVCTKVAAHLEQGQRLENLSWRLWHLQNLLVETDNAKSKREFRRLSKCMGEKLDKEKGRSIEELSAPQFTRNESNDRVRRLAEEKERNRENQHSNPNGHVLNRMQFTFEVDPPTPGVGSNNLTPNLAPSNAFNSTGATGSSANASANGATGGLGNGGLVGKNGKKLSFKKKDKAGAGRGHSVSFQVTPPPTNPSATPAGADHEMADLELPHSHALLQGNGYGHELDDDQAPMDMDISPSMDFKPLDPSSSTTSYTQGQGQEYGANAATPTNTSMLVPPDPTFSVNQSSAPHSTRTRLRFPSLFPGSGGGFAPTALLYTTPILEAEEYNTVLPDYSEYNLNPGFSGVGEYEDGEGLEGEGADAMSETEDREGDEDTSATDMDHELASSTQSLSTNPTSASASEFSYSYSAKGQGQRQGQGQPQGTYIVKGTSTRPTISYQPAPATAPARLSNTTSGSGTSSGLAATSNNAGPASPAKRSIAFGVRRPTIEVQLEEFLGPSTSEGEDGEDDGDADWEDVGHGSGVNWGVARGGGKKGSGMKSRLVAAAASGNASGKKNMKAGLKGKEGGTGRAKSKLDREVTLTLGSMGSAGSQSSTARTKDPLIPTLSSAVPSSRSGSGMVPSPASMLGVNQAQHTHGQGHGQHGPLMNVHLNNAVAHGPTPDIIDRAKTPRQNPRSSASGTTSGSLTYTNPSALTSVSAQSYSDHSNSAGNVYGAGGMAPTGTGTGATTTKVGGTKLSKSECVNCGATHTPLWRRGLNDELNCNACGLYCKLHKRPRPKTMRGGGSNNVSGTNIPSAEPPKHVSGPVTSSVSGMPTSMSNVSVNAMSSTTGVESFGDIVGGGESSTMTGEIPSASAAGAKQRKGGSKRQSHTSRTGMVASSSSSGARCVNCHTMATPLWRKDDEGKTVCNACGLYFKLHNANRPISMKSDVIRKRARHEAIHHQQAQQHAAQTTVIRGRSVASTPSATSPSVSRNSSPDRRSGSVERYPPLPNSPSSSNGHGQSGSTGSSGQQGEKPIPMGPDPYDPSQAAFSYPADHAQFDFPNQSPATSQLELGPSAWNENGHQANSNARRNAAVASAGGNGAPSGPSAYGPPGGGAYVDYSDYGSSSNFPGPFHPDYLRSLGVNIGGWDYGGGRYGMTMNAMNMGMGVRMGLGTNDDSEEVDQKPVINRVTGGISVDTNMDRSSKRRRLSTDSYASSIASATEPPSSASSLFPLGDGSTAPLSSHNAHKSSYVTHTHRRNQSSLSTQSSDMSHLSHSTTTDFSLDFFKHIHPPMMLPGDNNESEMMSLLNLNPDHPSGSGQPNVGGGSNEVYHPPMMLPFAEDYPTDHETPMGPPNRPNSGDRDQAGSDSPEFLDMDITMAGLFDSKY